MIYTRTTKAGKTRYVVKIYVRTTSEGKKIDKQVGTFGTRKEAVAAEAAANAQRNATASDETIASFASRWLTDYPRNRASTMNTHRNAIKAFVEAHGERTPVEVTKQEARGWVLKHPSSHAALRAMWNDMEVEEITSTNPFSALRIPQSRGRADITPPTETELANLIAVGRRQASEEYASMIEFAAYTGIRRGELCVLTWEDIDFKRDRVSISKTLSNDSEVLPPKNGKPRTVVLPPQAAAALKRLPTPINADTLIFTTPNGRRYSKSTWHYHWDPVRRAAGMPKLDWHVLRHFCATYMIDRLELSPHVAAKQLGHSDAGELLMRLYAHPDEEGLLSEIARAFESVGQQPTNLAHERDARTAETGPQINDWEGR